jgi:recombinase-like zinc beta ribbon protein
VTSTLGASADSRRDAFRGAPGARIHLAVHPQLLSDAFELHVKRLQLRPIRFHDLRHTYATLAQGTSANGNGGEYRYYTCRSRLERGRSGCNQDRIPASDIEKAIIDHLLRALDNETLLSACLDKHVHRLKNVGQNDEEELSKCERDARQTRSAIDRYLSAFEAGSMPADSCGPRLRELEARLAELETLKLSIESRIETKSLNSPSLDEVKCLAAEIRYKSTPTTTTRIC